MKEPTRIVVLISDDIVPEIGTVEIIYGPPSDRILVTRDGFLLPENLVFRIVNLLRGILDKFDRSTPRYIARPSDDEIPS